MAIADWNEAELENWLRRVLGEKFGIVKAHRVSGELPEFTYTERQEVPAAPGEGKVTLYAHDNGAGKLALYALFHTGAPQQVAVEP